MFLFSSCSNHNGARRKISSITSENCSDIVKHFSLFKSNKVKNKYSSYTKFNDPLTFNQYEKKYLKGIKKWAESGSRLNTMAQMRQNGAFSRIKTAFQIDTPFGIARQLAPLFAEVESSFYIAKRAHREGESLRGIVKELTDADDQLGQTLVGALKLHIKHTMLSDSNVNLELLEKMDVKSIKKAIVSDMASLNELLIDHAYNVQVRFDEYSVMRKFIAQSTSSKKVEVLEKLKLENLLSSCEICGDISTLSSPNLKQIESMLKNVKVVRIKYLKKQLFLEKWMTIVSRLPSQAVYKIIDKGLEFIPKLNNSSFRKWLRASFIDFKDRYKFFPRIDRVIFSKSSEKELIHVLNEYYAIDGMDFLVTMARRTDAQESWNKLFKWLKENKPQDSRDQLSILYSNMDSARGEAVKRGPMAEWHHPNNTYKTRFIVDLFMYSASGYLSYYYFGEAISKYTQNILADEEEVIDVLDKEISKDLEN